MTRGETKRILRQATQLRVRAEQNLAPREDMPKTRHEEQVMLRRFANLPSVFAIAEDLNKKYQRPLWASQRYGAR